MKTINLPDELNLDSSLSINLYEDIVEIIASFGMNIIVGLGFWLDWKDHKKSTRQ